MGEHNIKRIQEARQERKGNYSHKEEKRKTISINFHKAKI